MSREVQEELGQIEFVIELLIFTWRGSFYSPKYEKNLDQVYIAYRGIYKQGKLTLSDEHQVYQWVSKESVLAMSAQEFDPPMYQAFKHFLSVLI